MGDLITSIDFGTSKVCIVIAQVDKYGKLQILGMGKSKCEGLKKGVVVDIETTTRSILEALEQAENMADVQVQEVYINVPGGYSHIIRNKGIIAVSSEDREIGVEDIKRVLNSATIVSIPQDQQIIDIIPNQYIVDGYDEIKDPTGMVGVRLEADVDIITGSKTTILNLVKSVNKAGLEVLGIIMEPLATAEALLTRDESELGVLLIDIGAGTSDVSLFKNSTLIYSSIIPVAGNHITNDISVGMRIAYDESEEIKKKYGHAYTPMCVSDNMIDVSPIGLGEKYKISELQLGEIIEARINELFDIINSDLVKKGLKREILTGVVLTGGGVSYLKGIEELGVKVFGLPVRVGEPNYIGAKEPIFSTAIGLICYTLKRKFNYYIEYNNVENRKSKNKVKGNRNMKSIFKKIWDEYF